MAINDVPDGARGSIGDLFWAIDDSRRPGHVLHNVHPTCIEGTVRWSDRRVIAVPPHEVQQQRDVGILGTRLVRCLSVTASGELQLIDFGNGLCIRNPGMPRRGYDQAAYCCGVA